MKTILISKYMAELTRFASTDENRKVLNGVLFDTAKKIMVSTDGHRMGKMSILDCCIDVEDFPKAQGVGGQIDLPDTLIIPVDAIKQAVKAIPKSKYCPILANILLAADDVGPYLYTTDLETYNLIRFKPIDGQYPNYDMIIPREYVDSLTFNNSYLSDLQSFTDKRCHGVTIMIPGNLHGPIPFHVSNGSDPELLAIIMPIDYRDGNSDQIGGIKYAPVVIPDIPDDIKALQLESQTRLDIILDKNCQIEKKESEIKDLKETLKEYVETVKSLKSQLKTLESKPIDMMPTAIASTPKAVGIHPSNRVKILAALETISGPATPSAILQAIRQTGSNIKGLTPLNTIRSECSLLIRQGVIDNPDRGLYAIKGN